MDFGLGLVLTFTDRASAGLAGVTSTLHGLEDSVNKSTSQLGTLGNALSSLEDLGGGLTAAITKPVVAFAGLITSFGIGRASFVENMHLAFTSLIGDAQKASDYMQKLMGFAKTTPYTYESITNAAQALIAYGFEQNKILTETQDGYEGIVKVLGDWAGAVGKGEAGFANVAEILGKINSEGKVYAIRINQLQRQGIMASKIIGNMYGLAESDARAFIKTMSGTQFIDDLLKGLKEGTDGINGMTGAVDGLMGQMKKTWKGALDTFKSSLKTAGLNLMGAYEDQFGVTRYKFLENMTASLNNLSDSIKKISTVLQPLADIFTVVINKGSLFIKAIASTWDSMTIVSKDGTKSMSSLQKLISKVVVGLTLAGPALLIISKVGGRLVKSFVTIQTTFKSLLPFLTTFGLTLGLLAVAWKSDFAGMRTSLEHFTTGVISSFITARNSLTGDVAQMTAALKPFQNKTDFFSGLTIAIARVMTLFKALKEGWNDFTLNEDTFLKAKELGILPLIEALFDLKYRFDHFKAGFKRGWKSVSDDIGKILSDIAAKVDGTIFEDLLTKVTNFFQSLSNNDPQAWETLGETFGKLAAKATALGLALTVLKTVLDKVVTAFKVVNTIATGIVTVVTKIIGTITLVVGVIGRAISDVIGFFQLVAANGLRATMQGLFGTVATVIAGIVTTIAGAIIAVVNFVSQWENGFNVIKAILMTVGVAIATIGAIILGAPALIATAVGAVIAAVALLAIHIHDHWEQIKAFFAGIGEWLYQNIGVPFTNFIFGIGNAIKTFFTEKVPNAWSSFVQWVQSIPGKISTFFSNLGSALYTFFFETVPYYIGFGLGYAAKGIVNFFTKTIPNAWNSFISAWNNFWNVTFPSVLNSIGQFFINCGQKFVNFFTQTIPNLWNNFVSAWNNFWSVTFPSVLNSIGQFFINAGQKVVNFFTQTIPNAWNSFKTKWTNFWTVTFPSVLNNIGQFFINLKQNFITWGKNLIQGLKQGIQNAWTNLLNNISTWVNSFVQGFKDGWDIHSPSGVFEEIGGFLIQGLLNGATALFGKVTEKFTHLSDSVKEIFTGLKDKAKTTWGNMKTNISNTATNVKDKVTGAWSNLQGNMTNTSGNIKNNVSNTWGAIQSRVTSTGSKIKSSASTLWNNVYSVTKSKMENIKSAVSNGWSKAKESTSEILGEVKGVASNKWREVKGVFSGASDYFKTTFSQAYENIKSAFNGIDTFFRDMWDSIKNQFSDIGVNVGNALNDTLETTMNSVLGQLENILNSVSKKVNEMLYALTSVTNEGYYLLDENIHLPRFAEGGVVTKPTTAIVGEEGKEAVVPLERNIEWIDGLANQLGSKLVPYMSRLTPVSPSSSPLTPTVGKTNNYMTTNNSGGNTTYEGDTDNSMIFNEGAIQLFCQNTSDEEALRLAKKIMEIIKRQNQIDRMTHYASVV